MTDSHDTQNSAETASASEIIGKKIHEIQINPLDFCLSSLDYVAARYSLWAMFRVIVGTESYTPPHMPDLTVAIRQTLIKHYEKQYQCRVEEKTHAFSSAKIRIPILTMADSGVLKNNFPDGTPLLLEIPPKISFDNDWIKGQAFAPPFPVRVKAAIACYLTGAPNALIWVVSDSGETEEFKTVPADAALASRLLRKSEDLIRRIIENDVPDPENDDVEKAYIEELSEREATGQTKKRLTIEKNSEDEKIVCNYIELKNFQRQAASAAETAKKEASAAGRAVENMFKTYDEILLPDGRVLTPYIGRRRPGYQNGATWLQINVNSTND